MAVIERGQKEGQMFELRIYTCSMLHLRDKPWPKVLVIEHVLYPLKRGSNIWWGKHVSFSNERDFWTDRNEGCGILAVIEWKPNDIQRVSSKDPSNPSTQMWRWYLVTMLPKGEWLTCSGWIGIKTPKKLMRVFVHMFCFPNYIQENGALWKALWQEVWPRKGLFVYKKTALITYTRSHTW